VHGTKSRLSSNLAVTAPWVHTPQNVALGCDVGKISAGCLVFDDIFMAVTRCWFVSSVTADLVQYLPENSNRSYQALFTANEIVNTVVIDDRSTYQKYVIPVFDNFC